MRAPTPTGIALALALGAASLFVACNKSDAPKPAPAAQAVTPAGQPAQPSLTGGAPQAPPSALSASGEVLETMDAASYTYVRIKTAQGEEVWVAGPQTKVAVGDQVVARDAMEMSGFESQSLGRKFDRILFAAALGKPGDIPAGGAMAGGAPHGAMGGAMGGGAPHGAMGGAMGGAPHGAAGGGAKGDGASDHMAVDKLEIAAVPKAEGETGRTVDEVYGQAADLVGKPVAVRGTVVKFSPGIMGRNWIHIQDATGEAAKGTHDLTVTTQDKAKPGDRVTIAGTVATGKDFGAGYKYAVIVEEAKVTVEPTE